MTIAKFRPTFCKMGYHFLEGAEPMGVQPLEMTVEKNGRIAKVRSEISYTLLRCVCGEIFTTGFQQEGQS